MKRVLFVGESWHVHVTEAKGFDTFTYDYYEEATEFIQAALEKNGAEFCHIPSHLVEKNSPPRWKNCRSMMWSCSAMWAPTP